MNNDDFMELMEDYGDLAQNRIERGKEKVRNRQEYKNLYTKFRNCHDKLVHKYTEDEIDELLALVQDVNKLENTYMYMQGFFDGIILKRKNDNK